MSTVRKTVSEVEKIISNLIGKPSEKMFAPTKLELLQNENKILKRQLAEIKKNQDIYPQQVKQSMRLGKWSIVQQGKYYKAFWNNSGKIESVYIGKNFTPESARAKIQAKGFDVGD